MTQSWIARPNDHVINGDLGSNVRPRTQPLKTQHRRIGRRRKAGGKIQIIVIEPVVVVGSVARILRIHDLAVDTYAKHAVVGRRTLPEIGPVGQDIRFSDRDGDILG